jgi:hypothetical protein
MQKEEEAVRAMKTKMAAVVGFLLCLWIVAATPAEAFREPIPREAGHEGWLGTREEVGNLIPPTEGEIEGACGVAISPKPSPEPRFLYVSDYYHRAIHVFTVSGFYERSVVFGAHDPRAPLNTLNAICGLAVDPSGNLFADELHQRVLFLPGGERPAGEEQVIDAGDSTGIATDEAGDLYVDDRTYVAVYDAPVFPGEAPTVKIGLGSLGDAYGIAVDSKTGRVYVPDAADETVKVFEPAVKLAEPVATIDGPGGEGFNSLADATVAIDESENDEEREGEGHLLVVDNLEPGAEEPEAAVYEFDSAGAFLGRLPSRDLGEGRKGPVFGEPSGLTVNPITGDLFVTTGNGEKSNLLKYGPYQPQEALDLLGGGSPESGSGPVHAAARPDVPADASPVGAAAFVVTQRRGVRVKFDGKLSPHTLPRHGMAPVGIVIDVKIGATGGEDPTQLRRISIAINRNGRFTSQGLPVCRLSDIQPSTTSGALAACRSSLVGEGQFSANVKLPQQSPFPSQGKVLAFNGIVNGKPAVLAHIYGTQPVPTSTVLPFVLGSSRGAYGTTLEASLPQVTGDWGYVTGLRMNLRRLFSSHGKARSYLSAGCPAPAGFPGASFRLAKASFAFAGGPTVASVLNRTCKAKD